jgi:CDGSH-type Zn-finger protein
MTDDALIAQKSPYETEVEKDKTYYWCACGRSESQPFCDGSHKGTSFQPVPFTADKTGKVYLCGCKRTANQPYCDGSHQSL